MVYTLLFSITVIYLYGVNVRVKGIREFFALFLPVAGLLVLTLGLQDNVGTDYPTYLAIAQGSHGIGWIVAKNEILFVLLVKLSQKFRDPQVIFFLVGIIQVFFLTLISYEVKKLGYKLHDFFFLYFSLSLTFFNQFNGIRQYIAVYIIVYAVLRLMLYDDRLVYISLVVVAGLFHSSALYLMSFLFLKRLVRRKWPFGFVLLLLGTLLIISLSDLTPLLYRVLSYTPYRSYIGGSYASRLGIRGIITKIPKLAVVLFASFFLNRLELDNNERILLNLGYVASAVSILMFGSGLIWRFYQYLDLLMVFPVLIYFSKKDYERPKVFMALALVLMLLFKILIFPEGEYLYRSILRV